MPAHGGAEALSLLQGRSLAIGKEADREFFAADPAGNPFIMINLHNPPGQVHECLIPGHMPVCIVNAFEIIDIEQQQGHACSKLEGIILHQPHEVPAVIQPGQIIHRCLVQQLLLVSFLLAKVREYNQHPRTLRPLPFHRDEGHTVA